MSRLVKFVFLSLPFVTLVAASAVLAFWATETGRLPITGDEPHYLITSASVVRDGDFDVRNNYDYDATTHEIYDGTLSPHAIRQGPHLWPQHMPGLSLLVAIPFGLGGAIWARTMLAILIVPLLAAVIYGWSRTCLPRLDATVVTLGLLACSPIIFGASQIYPDLPAGVAALALASWLWGSNRRGYIGWCTYWCVAGLLCWLHVKYFAPTAVLGALGVWQLWRDANPRFTLANYWTFGILYLAGPALFWAFSLPRFGDLIGGRVTGELNFDFLSALELFLGLHFDQVHGLFIQQPLLLPGLVALGWMIRRRHPLTLPWLVLYLSLIVPNALQQVPYGGHVAPAGRFGWSAMWLWLVPLGIVIRELRNGTSFAAAVRLIVFFGVAYQAILALQWVPMPQRLFNGLLPADVWQPSLFADGVMLSLPKFGPHADVSHPPNTVWVLGALSLLAAGFIQQSRFRYLPAAATAILALFLLPAEDTLDRARTVPRRYEAENTPARCTVLTRRMASNGRICQQNANHLFAVNGPYVALEPGRYRVVAALHPGVRTLPGRGVLDVVGNRGYTAITRHSFRLMPTIHWTYLGVDFNIARTFRDVEFRIRGFRGLEVDYVEVHSIP